MTGSLKTAKTLVVKVGSSLVTNEGRGVDAEAVALWAEQIARLTSSAAARSSFRAARSSKA